MKSMTSVYYALLLTVVVAGITLFYQNKIVYITSILFISIFWLIAFNGFQRKMQQHDMVVERIEELKRFSVELQSLINKELALVQDDVIRIRTIVGDSIGILQDSTNNIYQNMDTQKQYLENVVEELNIDSSFKVKDRQRLDGNNVLSFDSVNALSIKYKSDIDNMMLALQFEDIVGQVSERVAQHVGDIRSTVDILSKLCESELSTTFEADMDNMRRECSIIKENLIKVSAKNLAAQKNMDEGDIELF